MNIFDRVKTSAFDTVTQVMGYDAVWISSLLGETFSARVGYKDPSEKQELSGIDSWNPDQPFMEYRIGFFEGLKTSVDQGNLEIVQIRQSNSNELIGEFAVSQVRTMYDGETFVARLIKTEL